jgi:hypothetical protein
MALLPAATAAGAVDVARIATAAKRLVGDAVYEAALGRGAAMTREQALDVIAGRRQCGGREDPRSRADDRVEG